MSGKHGIPARARAGAFGRHMWSRRWAADLEAGVSGPDIRAARRHARGEGVLSLEQSGRHVTLDVAGSRPVPFSVEFRFAPLDGTDADALRAALRTEESGVLGAISGEFSDTVGFLLLPAVNGATDFSCNCPVQPGPCRHVLAAAYIMVEWWDSRPAVLFTLRGLQPDQLGAVLRGSEDGAVSYDVEEALWGTEPELPTVPSPDPAGLEDLLDAPVTRRLASAAARDPLEQLRVVADLEDCLHAFSEYRP